MTDEFVTVNAADVLESIIDTNLYLRREAVIRRIDRSADHCLKPRVYEDLSAHDDKDTLLLRIPRRRMLDEIEVASCQSST